MSAARCRLFRSLFAGAVLPALKLDRESDHIYPSNLGIHRTKCAFDFFDPTGVCLNPTLRKHYLFSNLPHNSGSEENYSPFELISRPWKRKKLPTINNSEKNHQMYTSTANPRLHPASERMFNSTPLPTPLISLSGREKHSTTRDKPTFISVCMFLLRAVNRLAPGTKIVTCPMEFAICFKSLLSTTS